VNVPAGLKSRAEPFHVPQIVGFAEERLLLSEWGVLEQPMPVLIVRQIV